MLIVGFIYPVDAIPVLAVFVALTISASFVYAALGYAIEHRLRARIAVLPPARQ